MLFEALPALRGMCCNAGVCCVSVPVAACNKRFAWRSVLLLMHLALLICEGTLLLRSAMPYAFCCQTLHEQHKAVVLWQSLVDIISSFKGHGCGMRCVA